MGFHQLLLALAVLYVSLEYLPLDQRVAQIDAKETKVRPPSCPPPTMALPPLPACRHRSLYAEDHFLPLHTMRGANAGARHGGARDRVLHHGQAAG